MFASVRLHAVRALLYLITLGQVVPKLAVPAADPRRPISDFPLSPSTKQKWRSNYDNDQFAGVLPVVHIGRVH